MLRLALLEIALCNVYNAPRIVQSKEDILRTTSYPKPRHFPIKCLGHQNLPSSDNQYNLNPNVVEEPRCTIVKMTAQYILE